MREIARPYLQAPSAISVTWGNHMRGHRTSAISIWEMHAWPRNITGVLFVFMTDRDESHTVSPYTGTKRMWAQFDLNVNLPSFEAQVSSLQCCGTRPEEMSYGPPALRNSLTRHFARNKYYSCLGSLTGYRRDVIQVHPSCDVRALLYWCP
jgi:hypothetical protein